MPFGYLATAILAALCTALAISPPRPARTHRRSVPYVLGLVPTEAPVVVMALLLFSTVVAAFEGDLANPIGASAAVASTLTAVGLLVLVGRQLRSAALVDATFRREVAADTGALVAPPLSRRSIWLGVLFPFPVRPRAVARVAGLQYGSERRQRLDVFHRPGSTSAPILVHLHGGGFRSGGRYREARALLHTLAAHGWVTVSADYRRAPGADLAEMQGDVRAVVGWSRENAERFGADPGHIVVVGSSAGAYLAVAAADTEPDVVAVVLWYGFYGASDEGVAPAADLVDAPDLPPLLAIHGELDTVVLVDDARSTVARLQRAGAVAHFVGLRHGQHGFDLLRSTRTLAVVRITEIFGARPPGPRQSRDIPVERHPDRRDGPYGPIA
jgi:acetyl esterase/lipase